MKAILLGFFFSCSVIFANEVCVLKTYNEGYWFGHIEAHCTYSRDSRVLKADQSKNLTVMDRKAEMIKFLINRGYVVKSDHVLVKDFY